MAPRARALALALAFSASACGPGSAPADATPRVSANGARTVFPPGALAAGSLDITVPEGERVAVFVLNAAGRDGAAASLSTLNVAAPASAPLQQPLAATAPRPPGDAAVIEASRATAPVLSAMRRARTQALVAQAPAPAATTFCVLSGPDHATSVRRDARLAAETEHALLYVDASTSDLSDAEAAALAGSFERATWSALTRLLGPPPDLDGDGKVTLFLTDLPQLWGYFWANDLLLERDTSADCSGTRSNAADAIYLALPSAVTSLGWSRGEALATLLPGVAAHEFTHLLSFQRRCVARTCREAQDTWVEEGLAKLGEDEAGFGWNVDRIAGVDYLTRTHEAVYRGYDGRSLTRWEGDSVGNYEGAHAFFRYHADRLGPEILASLTSGAVGTRNVEAALGTSLPEAVADVATALLFSNSRTDAGAEYSFTGAGWTPLSSKLRRLDAAPLGAPGARASLRSDGWNAFVSGPAGAGGGSVQVASDEAVKPWVVVVRFRGEL